jgi:hypothetical protein
MRSKKTNSKDIIIILLTIALGVGLFFYFKQKQTTVAPTVNNKTETTVPVSITKETFKETNFSGTRVVIKGGSAVATAARKYENDTLASFKKDADNSQTSNYEIDFGATYIKSKTTESIVLDEYTYTGGANGMDSYKVFTASLATGNLVSLSSFIVPARQNIFTAYVKSALIAWRPEGVTDEVTFPEAVAALTFASFANWSLDNKNLTLYFDKDDIGPGALGSVAFPIPRSAIKDFIIK